jgi:hypothetical protein
MTDSNHKTLMRSLGEFFGHIIRAVRTDPRKKVVSRKIEEERRGSLTLRRTTIDEVEIRSARADHEQRR